MGHLPCILTIAGSDSGGGAGIQADLKTIAMLGGYGACVITALTAQNTATVSAIHAPPAEFVAEQLRVVTEDIQVDAAKTGMLFSADIITALAGPLEAKSFPLVVDPVCVATSGSKLLEDDAVTAMRERMFPLADLVTPNLPEAELFSGVRIHNRDDIFEAAQILLDMGPKAVLIKGGHSDSWAITDWLVVKGDDPLPLMQKRVATDCTHGTGCTLSSAIATLLGKGSGLVDAVKSSQQYLYSALNAGYRLGAGGGPPNHSAPLLQERESRNVMRTVAEMGKWLMKQPGIGSLFSRERTNLAVALPYASSSDAVCAFEGGVMATVAGDVMVAGCPGYGASRRTAAVLLAAREQDSSVYFCLTIDFSEVAKDKLTEFGSVRAVEVNPDGLSRISSANGQALSAVIEQGRDGRNDCLHLVAATAEDLQERVLSLVVS